MDSAPTFHHFFETVTSTDGHVDLWQQALSAFDAGDCDGSVRLVLAHLNPTITTERAGVAGTRFTIPHGSIRLRLTLDAQRLSITAPFLRLPAQRDLPILRQVAELNMSALVLSQIALDDDALSFRFACPLALAEPHKLVDVLREICHTADRYDDIFIERFGATRLDELEVLHYDDETRDGAYRDFLAILDEGLRYAAYFETKRQFAHACAALDIALLIVDFSVAPQGYLRSQLEDAIATARNAPTPAAALAKLRRAVETLRSVSRELADNSTYRAHFLIDEKARTHLVQVQALLGPAFQRAQQKRHASEFAGATLDLLNGIYDLFYGYLLPSALSDPLIGALRSSAGKPWREASDALWVAVQAILARDPDRPVEALP